MKSDSKTMQRLADEYTRNGGTWPLEATTVAEWAVRTKRWTPTPDDAVKLFREQFSRAMREEYATDSEGRRIRTKHAVRVKDGSRQIVLWDDIRTAPHSHMVRAFQQRRDQIVGDCRQLKNDVDSYNDARPEFEDIQLVLDFTLDMVELEATNRPRNRRKSHRLSRSSATVRSRRSPLSLVADPN